MAKDDPRSGVGGMVASCHEKMNKDLTRPTDPAGANSGAGDEFGADGIVFEISHCYSANDCMKYHDYTRISYTRKIWLPPAKQPALAHRSAWIVLLIQINEDRIVS